MKESFSYFRTKAKDEEGTSPPSREYLLNQAEEAHRLMGCIEEFIERRIIGDKIVTAVVGEISRTHISNTPRLIQTITAGLLALGFSVSDVLGADAVSEKVWTPEQIETLEQVTGMSFAELHARFTIEMPVAPGIEGKYILHLGQIHAHPEGGLDGARTADLTIFSQKALESLIEVSARANATGVFLEGITSEDAIIFTKKRLAERLREIDDALNDVPFTIEKISNFLRSLMEIDYSVSLNFLGSKLDLLVKEVEEVLPRLVPTNEDEAGKIEGIQMSIALYQMRKAAELSPRNPYLAGATYKLYFEDKISSIYPSESIEMNERAFLALAREKEVIKVYDDKKSALEGRLTTNPTFISLKEKEETLFANAKREVDGKTIVAEDRAPLLAIFRERIRFGEDFLKSHLKEEAAALEEAQRTSHKAIFKDRNEQALALIDEYDMKNIQVGHTLGNVILVYGQAHDFAPELSARNAGNSPHHAIQRGLIKISPRSDKK